MNLSAEQIMKLVEKVTRIPDILQSNGQLDDILAKFDKVESYLKRFNSLEELTTTLQKVESKLYLCRNYLTSEEAASYLRISKFSLLQLARKGELQYYAPPTKGFFFRRDELDRWISQYGTNKGSKSFVSPTLEDGIDTELDMSELLMKAVSFPEKHKNIDKI